jgi:hypothetical protein
LTVSGAGEDAGGGVDLSAQADSNEADRVTAPMSTNNFRYDFIGLFLTRFRG